MSLLLLIMGLAPILAPLIGGQLLLLHGLARHLRPDAGRQRALMAALLFIMRESLPPERIVRLHWRTIARNYGELLRHRGFIAHSLAGRLQARPGMFAYIDGVAARLHRAGYGVDPQHYGLLFGLNAAGLIAGSQLSARLLRRLPPRTLQRRALLTLALASLAGCCVTLAGWMTLPLLIACLIAYMGSQGLREPEFGGAGPGRAGPAAGCRVGAAGHAAVILRRARRPVRQSVAGRYAPAPDRGPGGMRLPVLAVRTRRAGGEA